MKLKFCGIREKVAWDWCVNHSVDYVGLNFVSSSKRRVSLDFLAGIKADDRLIKVGVFQDQSLGFIIQVANDYQLAVVQLHGTESLDFIKDLRENLSLDIWKAWSPHPEQSLNQLQDYGNICDLVLLDGACPGSGKPIESREFLNLAVSALEKNSTKYGLAGGINAANIADFAHVFSTSLLLDTASGIERSGIFAPDLAGKILNQVRYV